MMRSVGAVVQLDDLIGHSLQRSLDGAQRSGLSSVRLCGLASVD